MAETYGVFDWRALPIRTAATLVQGLSVDSRVMRALAGHKGPSADTMLLAIIADRLGHLAWMFSENGQEGKNHPPSIFALITGDAKEPEGYDTAEDFFAAWAAITGGDANA